MFWAELGTDVNEENRRGYPKGKVKEGRVAELLREYPNLYCDMSAGSGMNALSRDFDYAAKFMAEFSDRVMFGLDVCAVTNRHMYDYDALLDTLVKDKVISEDTYYKFVRGNAERILKLK